MLLPAAFSRHIIFLTLKNLYPTGVPHSEKNCTPRVPHLQPFVPHSRHEQMATLVLIAIAHHDLFDCMVILQLLG